MCIYININNHNKTYTSWWFQPVWKTYWSNHFISYLHLSWGSLNQTLSLNFFTNISANLKGIHFFSNVSLWRQRRGWDFCPSCYLGISDVWSCQLFLYIWKTGVTLSAKNTSTSSALSPASLRICQQTPWIWTPNIFFSSIQPLVTRRFTPHVWSSGRPQRMIAPNSPIASEA